MTNRKVVHRRRYGVLDISIYNDGTIWDEMTSVEYVPIRAAYFWQTKSVPEALARENRQLRSEIMTLEKTVLRLLKISGALTNFTAGVRGVETVMKRWDVVRRNSLQVLRELGSTTPDEV